MKKLFLAVLLAAGLAHAQQRQSTQDWLKQQAEEAQRPKANFTEMLERQKAQCGDPPRMAPEKDIPDMNERRRDHAQRSQDYNRCVVSVPRYK